MALLGDGRFIVAGGRNDGDVEASADIFDPGSGHTVWNPVGAMAIQRFAAMWAVLPNGNLLVCGGYDGDNDQRTCELFDIATDTWVEAPPMADRRGGGMAVTLLDGSVLICGGAAGDATGRTCDRFR
jgi:hypothetical protein